MERHESHRRGWPAGRLLRLLVAAAGLLVVLAGAPAALAAVRPDPVTSWAAQHATPLATVDPGAPLDDLEPLRRSIGDAQIVGLGESVHGASQEETLKHRVLRFLVERMGFRSIAWEEDWTTGLRIDAYIRTGRGDLGALMRQMGGQWQSREVADALRWLRDFNRGRADKVRFVGVEYFLTGSLAYDAVRAYVARTAPERLPELERDLRVIRPSTPDIYRHIARYRQQEDKEPYIRRARRVYGLVARLPHRRGDRAHAVALQHARQILLFHVHYDLSDARALVYREAQAARNLRWWRALSGDRIAYWAASPHTANAPDLRIVMPPDGVMRFPSAGSYLRRRLGPRYLSIGFTFDHGAVSLGAGRAAPMPEPRRGWFERPLGRVGLDQLLLDLRAPAPPAVRAWLRAPIRTRGLADAGPNAYMAGGTLARWFDVIAHRQVVTPTRPA